MTEAELQSNIIEAGTKLGWSHYHTWRSEKSDPGYPDLTLVSVSHCRVIWIECKSEKGDISPEQTHWHDMLAACDQEIYVVRPVHWPDEVLEILTLSSKPSKAQRMVFDSSVVKL